MGIGSGRTVTFLFTDVESSTQRWQEDPAGMAAALVAHDVVLRGAIEAAGGRVFKHTGDGVCAVFESATRANAAALQAQSELQLPVRIGLHTGEAEEREGDFFGTTLNRCARIMDAGHGGQILVSAVTRSFLDDVECVDLGEWVLKGFEQPERIFQVGAGAFPPLRTQRRLSFLPIVLTSLIGRDDLVREVADRVRTARLVTLVGVGGVGKTRVALAVAEQVALEQDLGVFVDLAEVSDDRGVVPALARSLRLTSMTSDAIGVAISGRRVLVVLDNCEHVLDGAADLVEDLLRTAPMLRVLATSREGLSLDGEHLVAVPGLDGSTAGSAGVALFLDRARRADASFELREDQTEVISEICRRLDGLPLAIELAAARVGVLTPADLLGRLDERFAVLTGGRRRRSRDRQRTLRETVHWSYRLLEADEQRVFAKLSVFAGSFDLDGAAAVLEEHDRVEVLDLIEALVDKSLLMVTNVDGLRRYRYLETLRSYAEERLEERGDAAALRLLLHQHLCSVVVHSVDEMLRRSNRGAARLRAEIPNLRRVFDDALDRRDVAAATAVIAPFAEMVGGIDWRITGWAAEVLALAESAGSHHEPHLLALDGIDQWMQGGFGNLHRLAEQMLQRAASRGDVPYAVEAVAECFFQLTGDDKAVALLAASRTTRLGRVDPDRLLRLRQIDIWCHLVPAQPGAAPELAAEELAVIDAMIAHPSAYLRGLGSLLAAVHAQRTRRPSEMLAMGEEAASLLVVGSSLWFASLLIRAWAEWELGDYRAAIRTADDHLDHAYNHGDRSAMIMPLLVYALVLESLGEVEAAATVRGHLPGRMTFVLVSQLARLDQSLVELLESDRRAELITLGRAMDPRHLQALTHTAAARHIELEPSGR